MLSVVRGIEQELRDLQRPSIPHLGSQKRLGLRITGSQKEGPFDEFPAETDEEDEDSDMSLQFQRPKGPDVNYVLKNIAKIPTFILNAVIGLANKTTWAMIEQKMGKRGALVTRISGRKRF
ncbi:hypothetical protein Tco_0780463 [Tanacetum coccineum]